MVAPTKIERYQQALAVIRSVLGPEGYQVDSIGKMAIVAAVLKMHFPEWIFVGFYRVTGERLLEIGPYQGDVIACGTIAFGRGVCGACAEQRKTVIVADVNAFPGYIACDDQTRAEIVVPILHNGQLTAVLDVDGAEVGAFDQTDRDYLEQIAALIA
jgi:GAF domain-containing protein